MKRKHFRQWNPLDNAAKIFPVTSSKADVKVFRFACGLTEDIDEAALTQALDKTLERFPVFLSVMKKGLFWYYLEHTDKRPAVAEEQIQLLSPLYDENVKNLLFRVSYYKKRINLEVFHALTDGTGAMFFLQVLVYHYLLIVHPELCEREVVMALDASAAQMQDDSFDRYYEKKSLSGPKSRRQRMRHGAYQLAGTRYSEHRMRVIEGCAPVKLLLAEARKRGITLTTLLAAVMLRSIYQIMPARQRKKPVTLDIPVNLRNYFPSASARNFFGVVQVGYDFNSMPDDLESITAYVDQVLKEELTPNRLEIRMHKLGALEHNPFARIAPLVLKDFFMKIGYRVAAAGLTASLSNVGRVVMPEALCPYIEEFDVFCSCEKVQMCMCSFNGVLRMSFSGPFVDSDLEKNFFRALVELGIPVTVTSNRFPEEMEGGE